MAYTVKQLKNDVRHPYAWPGGYEVAFLTSDGAILCQGCVRKNFREVLESTKKHMGDGWQVVGTMYEAVSADCAREVDPELISYCDQCNKEFGEFGA